MLATILGRKSSNLKLYILVVDCTVYNEDKTESYPIIANKCGDDYIATKHLDGYAVEQRARFSYTVFEFVDSNDGDENQTLQGGLLF